MGGRGHPGSHLCAAPVVPIATGRRMQALVEPELSTPRDHRPGPGHNDATERLPPRLSRHARSASVKERFLSSAVSPSARRIPADRPVLLLAGWLVEGARRQGAGVNVERPQAVRPRTNDVDAGDGWRTLARASVRWDTL